MPRAQQTVDRRIFVTETPIPGRYGDLELVSHTSVIQQRMYMKRFVLIRVLIRIMAIGVR
jgi:hypothetical protein